MARHGVTYDKRNPTSTLPSLVKCRYNHLKFCTQLGHRDSKSKNCYTNGMAAAARAEIVAAIVSDTTAKAKVILNKICIARYTFHQE